MLRKGLLIAAMAGVMTAGAFAAEVIVNVAPPRPVVEHAVPRPGPEYVWTSGYHRWVHRNGGWVMVEGHWR